MYLSVGIYRLHTAMLKFLKLVLLVISDQDRSFAFTKVIPGRPLYRNNNKHHENLQKSPTLTKPQQKHHQHPQTILKTPPLPTNHTPQLLRPLPNYIQHLLHRPKRRQENRLLHPRARKRKLKQRPDHTDTTKRHCLLQAYGEASANPLLGSRA